MYADRIPTVAHGFPIKIDELRMASAAAYSMRGLSESGYLEPNST